MPVSNLAHESRTPRLTLILGGTRSGKSAFAERQIHTQSQALDASVLYIATAERRHDDPAMQVRIERHQARRPASWTTLECPHNLPCTVEQHLRKQHSGVILLDCVTLWVSNLLFSLPDPEDLTAFETLIEREVTALLQIIETSRSLWYLVSGETGLGLIAPTRLGRVYCDGLGLANQLLSAHAHEAFLVVAGRPLPLPAPASL